MEATPPASLPVLANGRPALCTPLPDHQGAYLRYLDQVGGQEIMRSAEEIRTCLDGEDAEAAITALGVRRSA